VDGGQPSVERVTGEADLTLPVAALASLYSGFRSATELSRAGRLEGAPEALRRADALFRTAYRPHVLEGF
jgi:predicted acetyltransferase